MWPRRAVEQRPVSGLLEPRKAAAAVPSSARQRRSIERDYDLFDLVSVRPVHAWPAAL